MRFVLSSSSLLPHGNTYSNHRCCVRTLRSCTAFTHTLSRLEWSQRHRGDEKIKMLMFVWHTKEKETAADSQHTTYTHLVTLPSTHISLHLIAAAHRMVSFHRAFGCVGCIPWVRNAVAPHSLNVPTTCINPHRIGWWLTAAHNTHSHSRRDGQFLSRTFVGAQRRRKSTIDST